MLSRKRCQVCSKLSEHWSKSGSFVFCYDGCFGTTGWDRRTINGKPLWEMSLKDQKKYQIDYTTTERPAWVMPNRERNGLSTW
jgi:hypothetical protein